MALAAWLMLSVVLFVKAHSSFCPHTEGVVVVNDTVEVYWTVSRFYDESRTLDVVLFNWSKRPFYLKLLISLCGDIHLNPGPDFPCGVCGNVVSVEDKAMCCDNCDMWIHILCDKYISEEHYDYSVDNPSSDPWICSTCTDLSFSNVSRSYSVGLWWLQLTMFVF